MGVADQCGLRVQCCGSSMPRPFVVVEDVQYLEQGHSDDDDPGMFDDLYTRPGVEAPVRPLPSQKPERPSDRAAHRQVLERCFRIAHQVAATRAELPLLQGRCCIAALCFLDLLRMGAWCQDILPGRVVFGIHWLTTTSDLACLGCAIPFFLQGTRGRCVQLGCVGPMITLIFSMCLADVGALLAYLSIARPQPLAPGRGRNYGDVLEASIGAWEFMLFASVALQITLCLSAWRVYRELRVAGLYPPGARPMGTGEIAPVSCLELVCEADDAARFHRGCDEQFSPGSPLVAAYGHPLCRLAPKAEKEPPAARATPWRRDGRVLAQVPEPQASAWECDELIRQL